VPHELLVYGKAFEMAEAGGGVTTVRIPFGEVVPDAWLEGYVCDGRQFVSVVHLIEHVCGRPTIGETEVIVRSLQKAFAKWGRTGDFQRVELNRYDKQYGVSIPCALKVLEMLPRDAARLHRAGVTEALCKWYSGEKDELYAIRDAGFTREREWDARPKPVVVEPVKQAAPEAKPVKPVLKEGHESAVKVGAGGACVRMVVRGGKEYVSTRDVIKVMIEKTGKPVVQMWAQVLGGKGEVFEGRTEKHKFKGSGEVEHDVVERAAAVELARVLTGDGAERNREAMLAALYGVCNDADVGKAVKRARLGLTKEELLEELDALDPDWYGELIGQPGAKRGRHVNKEEV
jgi:hypothetical protein